MLEPKKIEIDEMKFQLIPLKALEAVTLDKKVLELLLPALGGIQDLSLDANIDMEVLSRGVTEALSNFDDEKTLGLILNLLKNVTYIESGKPPRGLNDQEVINDVFRGKHFTIFKLMFEVMKFNKFTPFVLVAGGGNLTEITSFLSSPEKEVKTNGNKSGKLGNLLENSDTNGQSGK